MATPARRRAPFSRRCRARSSPARGRHCRPPDRCWSAGCSDGRATAESHSGATPPGAWQARSGLGAALFDASCPCGHNDHMARPQRVGVRELKTRLGAYLQRVRQGRTLVVTDRGEPIAELRPLESPTDDDAVLALLEAAGAVTRPTRQHPGAVSADHQPRRVGHRRPHRRSRRPLLMPAGPASSVVHARGGGTSTPVRSRSAMSGKRGA